jgi:hypothetical protein
MAPESLAEAVGAAAVFQVAMQWESLDLSRACIQNKKLKNPRVDLFVELTKRVDRLIPWIQWDIYEKGTDFCRSSKRVDCQSSKTVFMNTVKKCRLNESTFSRISLF